MGQQRCEVAILLFLLRLSTFCPRCCCFFFAVISSNVTITVWLAALALQKTGLIDTVLNLPNSESVYFSSPLLVFLLSCLILFYHLLLGLPRGFTPWNFPGTHFVPIRFCLETYWFRDNQSWVNASELLCFAKFAKFFDIVFSRVCTDVAMGPFPAPGCPAECLNRFCS
jgi:hypothetical protein